MKPFLLLIAALCYSLQVNAQDCECKIQDEYDYVTYTGKHRSLLIPKTCDSLISNVHIENFLNYGDIYYERAAKFFDWEFIYPKSLETTVNPSLGGGGTGRGGTGLGMQYMGIDVNSFDPLLSHSMHDLQNVIIHEGVHRWDFRGNNYFVGPDIAHPLNVVMDQVMSVLMEGSHYGQHINIAPYIEGELGLKILYRYYWARYLSDPNLDWNHYFGADYNFEELDKKPKPEAFERLSIQGAPLLSIYFMHGLEGLQSIFAEIEKQRLSDPEWKNDDVADKNKAVERFIRIFADGLDLDVTPYFEYWKYPMSPELKIYLKTLPPSDKINDIDGDGFSPLHGDFDDTDSTIFPNAPELIDGIDNNQDGQIDEAVISDLEVDLPSEGKGPELTLPGLVLGQMSDLNDIDVFHLNIEKKTTVNLLYTSINGNETCSFEDGRKLELFSAFLKLNGGVLQESEVFSGQNNNHWIGYLEAGEHIFKIDNDWEFTCPGDYEIRIFISDGIPKTIEEAGMQYTNKEFDGLEVNPDFDPGTAIGVKVEEAEVLKKLYNNFGGPEWWNPRGWLTSPDVCYWEGLNCDKTGLSNLFMFGDRPLDKPLSPNMIGTLKNLREFRMHGSNFQRETLPDTFHLWRNISMFEFNGNNITGPLPNSLAGKQKLWYLNLSGNDFEGSIPKSWSSITNLKYLNLEGTNLSGSIPEEFTRLTNLETFLFDVDDVCASSQQVMNWLQSIPTVSQGYTLCTTTHAKSTNVAEMINLYPNPTMGNVLINVTSDRFSLDQVEVIDLLGKRIMRSHEHKIDISSINKGTYWAKIKLHSGEQITKPFIIN